MRTTYSVPFVHGKERPRFGGLIHISDTTADNEARIAYAYKGASIREHGQVVRAPDHVPVTVTIHCTVPGPKRRPTWCPKVLWDALGHGIPFVKKPDVDNVAKEHADALNGVAWHDDAQVTELHVFKDPQVSGGEAFATVTVEWEEL